MSLDDDVRDLTLPFLGARAYLQGTTLFEALAALAPGATDLSFKIAKPILTDRVRLDIADEPPGGPCAASLALRRAEGGGRVIEVRPLPASAQIRREPFAEPELIDLTAIEGETISLRRPSPFSTVKTIVSLNKALLTRLWQPALPGQWLFVRLDIGHYPVAFEHMAVTYRMKTAFAALTSDVSVDGAPLGRVVFSWRTI